MRTAVFLGASFLLLGCQKEPVDYDDCILKKLSAGMSEEVADVIAESCRNKFPAKEIVPEPFEKLPPSARENVHGRFGVHSYGGSGNIYNGNREWRLEEVTIIVGEPDFLKKSIARKKDPTLPEPRSETYLIKVSVPPLSSENFSIDVNWRESEPYQWFFLSARGVKVAE